MVVLKASCEAVPELGLILLQPIGEIVKAESEPEPESQVESEPPQSSSESSDAAGEHTAKFAVAYHTIDTSGKYNSTREDSN